MLRGRVKFPTGGIVHDHACVLMRCNSSTDGTVRMKGAILFPPRIILGFFNARKDILMTEKKDLINGLATEKVFTEEDFAFVDNNGNAVADTEGATPSTDNITDDANNVDDNKQCDLSDNNEAEYSEEDKSQGENDEDEFSKRKLAKKKGLPTRKLCGMAVLTALSIVLACTLHIPVLPSAPFLEYSPSDVPVLIASFMYGPVWGLVITAIVSLIQGLTVSAASGWIGIAMNFLSTGVFVLSAGLIYKFKHDIKGATIGIVVGFVSGVATMILWNILITPLYMGVTREVVIAMIPTAFLPFNLLKYAANGAMTFSLYKATGKLFKMAFKNVPDKTVDEDTIEGKHTSRSVEDTTKLATRIADTLEGGEVIVLDGDLGAGKTTFTKGLAEALGIKDQVTSPTFTIMNVYEDGKFKLNHLDMYRIESEDELYELGVEDAMTEDTITVIEWNKLALEGKKVIKINITTDKNKRIFTVKYENTCS